MSYSFVLKRIGLVALCLILCGSSLLGSMNITLAGGTTSHPHSGSIGDTDVTWSFDESSGKLTIGGSGRTETFSSKDDQPWKEFRQEITEVWFDNMEQVEIPDLAHWFSGCAKLEQAEIPYKAVQIGDNAFSGCSNLTKLMFYYTDEDDFSIKPGAFRADKSTKTSVFVSFSEERVLKEIMRYNWDRDNRAAVTFADLYSTNQLSTMVDNSGYFSAYYCDTCGNELGLDHDLQDSGNGRHARYWGCMNSSCARYLYSTSLDGVWQYFLIDDHDYSNGVCIYCGYTDSDYGSSGEPEACDHSNDSYFEYTSNGKSGHYEDEYCSDCDAHLRHSGPYSHTLQSSVNGCTTTKQCSYCSYSTSSTSHSYSTTYTYSNATYHVKKTFCTACDLVSSSSDEAHTWSVSSYSKYSTTKHKIKYSCSACDGEKIGYASHSDTNEDDLCDQCGAVTAVTITWNASANGGKISGANTTTTKVSVGGTATVPSSSPVKTGYQFSGWFTSKTGGNAFSTSTTHSSATTYYAQYSAKKYTITWNLGGGVTSTSQQAYDAALTLPSTPSKKGYTFLGWYTAASGGTKVTSSTVYKTDGASTYYAQWSIHSSNLKVDPNGGTWDGHTTTQSYTQNYNTTLKIPVPTKKGYAFAGWTRTNTYGTISSTTAAATYTFGSTNGVTDTLKASWTAKKYTVTWNVDGVTSTSSQTYDSTLVLPATPSKSGYTFTGWYTAAAGGTKVTSSTVYKTAGNQTYYAQFSANKYNITWSYGNGNSSSTKQEFNTTLSPPSEPKKEGYEFRGWYTKETGGEKISKSTIYLAANDTTYYARWLKSLEDTGKIIDMSYMFSDCTSLNSLDMSLWGTGSVTTMSHMFSGCSNLKHVDTSRFNTAHVKDLSSMFKDCASLETIDLCHFNVGEVATFKEMFSGTTTLKAAEISTWDFVDQPVMTNIFTGPTHVYTLDEYTAKLVQTNSSSSVQTVVGPMP